MKHDATDGLSQPVLLAIVLRAYRFLGGIRNYQQSRNPGEKGASLRKKTCGRQPLGSIGGLVLGLCICCLLAREPSPMQAGEPDTSDSQGGVTIRLQLRPSAPPASTQAVSKADTAATKADVADSESESSANEAKPARAAQADVPQGGMELAPSSTATAPEKDGVAAGDKINGDKADGDKADGDKAEGDKVDGDKAEGDKAEGDKVDGDKASGDKASGDKASGDKASGSGTKGEGANGSKNGPQLELGMLELPPRPRRVPAIKAGKAEPRRIVGPAPEPLAGETVQADKLSPSSGDSKECPGSPSDVPQQDIRPEDIPLEQEEHPYDAPAVSTDDRSIELESSSRARSRHFSDSSDEAKPQASGSDSSNPTGLEPSSGRFTQRELRIQAEIRRCLDYFLANPENTTRRGPWALMHASLPFGAKTEIIAGNRRVNALGWMCYNGVCAKQRMFQPTRQGFRTNVGPGVQGHEGQFLAILAQCNVRSDYPLRIGNRSYQVMDLVRYEMSNCRERSELTFQLIGLSHYLDQNQRWRDRRGSVWTLEKMVAEELSQPINGAACGGTHRLMGLSYAVIRRQAAGYPVDGQWSRAEQYLNDYIRYAMTLQNPDGSFSTNWFEARGMDADVERKVQTTGHILEWLVYTLPDDHLRFPKIQLGIEFLLNSVGRQPGYDWPIGPRGHALRTLALYDQRVFAGSIDGQPARVAEQGRPAAQPARR